jgi:hypothetical protein
MILGRVEGDWQHFVETCCIHPQSINEDEIAGSSQMLTAMYQNTTM